MNAVVDMLAWAAEKASAPMPTFTRRYDISSYNGRNANWWSYGSDADAANADPTTARNRARDLRRNNPWAAKLVTVATNNAIGYGIRAQIQAKSKGRAERAQNLWRQWAETTVCDADGMHDFYGLQSLAFSAMAESGEVMIRLRPRRPEDRLPLPLQLQVLEADYLSENEAEAIGVQRGNEFHRGIEFDALGRRVAYHLYREHPGSDRTFAGTRETTRVPANEIIHLYRKDRPGQQRGISWYAPIATTLRDIDITEQAYIRRQQLANLFAGFIIGNDPSDMMDEFADELPDLQPGTMYAMRPGTQIEWSNPPDSTQDPAFRDWALHRVAAGYGLSYEALTGNLSEVNFSSARLGAQEMGRNIDSWVWNLFIPRFCQGVMRWFLDAVSIQTGMDTSDMTAEWTPPKRIQVDPNKENDAILKATKGGWMSIPEAIREQGYDPVAVAEENKAYLDLLDGMGLKVESDFRNSAKIPVEKEEKHKTPEMESADD